MKKLFFVLLLIFSTSNVFAASATVGGTLKVFTPLAITKVIAMNFPSQYQAALGADLYTQGASPVPSGTPGNLGSFEVDGAAGASVQLTVDVTMSMTHNISPTPISAAIYTSVDNQVTWVSSTTPPSFFMPGSGLGMSAWTIYLKGKLPVGTNIVSGTYNGFMNISAAYN
ncbi:MAG: DUF4402 domain-containing protein [bacterium]